MKLKHFLISSPIFVAAFITAYAVAQNSRSSPMGDPGDLIVTVLNPEVLSKMAERLPLAPRLDSIEGKTIYMVDINWGGPEAALSIFEEMQAWFAQNVPSVKTVIKMKRGGYDADDPPLWKEIIENKGDAAILGVSG